MRSRDRAKLSKPCKTFSSNLQGDGNMNKERRSTILSGTQVPVCWLSKLSSSTRSGAALLILLIAIGVGLLIYLLMSSGIFKPESLEERPQAEKKMGSEDQFIATIEGIIKNGENINAEQNRNKRTLLHLAVKKGYARAAKLLLDNNADINARDVMEATPLHLAVFEDNVEIAKLLIANGADLNATSTYLSTPLHNAARSGKVQIAKLLLENGADANATAKPMNTPLKEAITVLEYELTEYNRTTPERQREIIKILRSYGARE
jgi:ankyrin repeat protein